MAVGICLRWQRGAAPGRAVAAIFAVFFMSASFLTIQPHSESISANPPALLTDETVTHALDSIGGYFIENKGQVADGIRYYSTGNPSVGFRDDGVMFVIRETSREERKEAWRSPIDYSTAIDEATTVRSLAYMLRFEESNKVTPIGIDRLPFNSNFFIGNDPSGWRTDVPNFAEVAYEGLYEGIDLVYHQAPGGLKYEFVVHPGADPRSISLSYEGVDSLRVDDAALIAVTPLGEVHDSVPYSHQAGREVTCSFAVRRPGSYGFDCENWDRSTNLIIDPLVYSTFLGGGGFDSADSIAVDSSGNAYVSGGTYSTDFPVTPGVLNTTLNGYEDIFVTKLNPGGSSIIYSTYLGGNGRDGWAFVYASSIAVDSFGGAFVTGGTNSVDFPVTPTAYDPWFNGYWDAFVVRLNVTGSGLAYSTYLGGNAGDWGNGIAVDLSGSAYVTGETWSVGFPVTPGAFDRRLDGFYDAFVAKLDSTGGSLLYSTYLGGNGDELGYSIAIDSIGNAYVTGGAWSAGFPVTPGAFDTTFNLSGDAFVTKLNATGTGLVYSTFLGGSGTDVGYSLTVDSLGCAYVTGNTSSIDFPVTPGAYDPVYSVVDAFVTKLNASGSALVYSTFLGGAGDDVGHGITVDSAANAYVTGDTGSPDFPVTNGALDTSFNGNEDAFVTELNATGSSLVYSTFLGGMGWDYARSVGLDFATDIYIAGGTYSNDFPVTPGAFDVTYNGDADAFVAKIGELADLTVEPADISFNPSGPVAEGSSVTIDATVHNIGKADASQVKVRFHDGLPPSSPTIGSDKTLPFIARLGGTGTASVTWLAGHPGVHDICVVANPDNDIPESDKTNNVACMSVEVLPLPDYVPVNPLPSSPVKIGLSLPLQLSVQVLNQGDGRANATATVAFYNESSPGIPFATFTVQPLNRSETSSRFTAMWRSPATPGTRRVTANVDYRNNVPESNETNNNYTWMIEVVPGPITSLVVGTPNDTSAAAYVKSSTPLDFSVLDHSGLGIRNTTYTIDGGNLVNYTDTGTFFLAGEGVHTIEWRSLDWAGNLEDVSSMDLTVDDTAPATAISIGEPKYLQGGIFIKSYAPITFSATDAGVGSNSTFYRLWWAIWSSWDAFSPSSFLFMVGEGTWYAEFLSYDYLGNVESVQNQTIVIDDTPPATTIHQSDEQATAATVFTLTATDSGCGVDVTMYRVDGGVAVEYVGAFTLSPGVHDIYYRSADHLGNVEAEQHKQVTVRGPTEVAVNYKPLVALVFAIVLLVAGVWSSKRRPWKGGKDRMAVAKAFAIFSLPCVLAEVGTGILSFATGELKILPIIGIGTAADSAILAMGLAITIFRGIKSRQEPGVTV